MSTDVTDSWSRQYACRRQIATRFGDIFDLPLAKRARDILCTHVADGHSVLEIGAGDRRMSEALRRGRNRLVYESMDIDPCGKHDYVDLAEIEKPFDVVFAFEVVEHIHSDALRPWMAQVAERIKPGGTLILSTPNTCYPPAYLRDITHRTPLSFDELGGLVEAVGLRVRDIFRIYNDPLHRLLLRRFLFGWMFRLLGIDYARQIVLVARKPTGSDG